MRVTVIPESGSVCRLMEGTQDVKEGWKEQVCQVSGQGRGEGRGGGAPGEANQLVEITEAREPGVWGQAGGISHCLETPGRRRGNWALGLGGVGDRMEGGDADVQKCGFQGRWGLRREVGKKMGPPAG